MHSSNSNWVLPALYHRLYFSIPSGGDVELLITDTVGLEGAFADSAKERRFGEELTPAVTDKAAGQAQLEWLEKTLAAPKTTTWRMVAGHRPIVSGSARFVRDAVAFPVEGRFRAAMQQLMTKYQVDVYLDGTCLARQGSPSAFTSFQAEG
jgi:tartrate-resistant acid phosphatase type 5